MFPSSSAPGRCHYWSHKSPATSPADACSCGIRQGLAQAARAQITRIYGSSLSSPAPPGTHPGAKASGCSGSTPKVWHGGGDCLGNYTVREDVLPPCPRNPLVLTRVNNGVRSSAAISRTCHPRPGETNKHPACLAVNSLLVEQLTPKRTASSQTSQIFIYFYKHSHPVPKA